MNNIVHGSMTVMSANTLTATKTMQCQMVHFSTTMMTTMRPRQRRAHSETNSYLKGDIIHPEAQGENGKCVQPLARFIRSRSQKTSTGGAVRGIVEKVLSNNRHNDGVPSQEEVGHDLKTIVWQQHRNWECVFLGDVKGGSDGQDRRNQQLRPRRLRVQAGLHSECPDHHTSLGVLPVTMQDHSSGSRC